MAEATVPRTRRRSQRAINRAEARRRKAVVTSIEDNGKYVSVRYVQDDGQTVQAVFHRVGWERSPREITEQLYLSQIIGSPTYLHPRR